MSVPGSLVVRLVAAMVLATGLAAPAMRPGAAGAASPTITVTPASAAPHAVVQISGSGFDPSTGSRTVLVDILVQTAAGQTPVATLQVDANGALGTNGSGQITLPFTLDAPGPDQVIATEEGNSSVTATASITGLVLQPVLNSGRPITGQPGASLTVQGSGFAPNDVISLTLNGTPLAQPGGQQTLTADAAGNVSIPFTLPAGATGTQTLSATGSAKGQGQNDQTTVQILAGAPTGSTGAPGGLQISPNPAQVGTALHLSAGGFQPGEQVSFALQYFDTALNTLSAVNAPAVADASGNASAVLTIPSTADGSKPGTVIARGISSGFRVAGQVTFAQLATITISPAGAQPGAQITISGAGFVPGEAVYATSRLFKPPIGRLAVADATGSFTVTETLLTTLQTGTTLTLAVSGSGGDDASTSYTVGAQTGATLVVTPSTVAPGGQVAVTGQGFGSGEGIAFSFAGAPIAVSGVPPLTSASGAFSATITLPSVLIPGSYTLTASGVNSHTSAGAQVAVTGVPGTTWYFAEGFTGQGPTAFFQESLSVLNPGQTTVHGAIVYQFVDGSSESVPLSVAPHSLGVENVNRDVGANRILSTVVQTDAPVVAQRTITHTGTHKHPLDTDSSPGVSAPQSTWYFAEGYSGISFQPYLIIENPTTSPVTATVTLNATQGPAKQIQSVIAAGSRATLNLRAALPNRSFSIRVDATAPVVAERVEYWGAGAGSAKFGAGIKPGATSPGTVWYFVYNSVVKGDQSYLSLYNPGTRVAQVQVVYFSAAGAGAGSRRITVAPNQRQTVLVNQNARKSPITAIVSADQPIVAEEAQYFAGSPNQGEHAGIDFQGEPASAHSWSFASGDTQQYQESEYIFNPSPHQTATVTATFYGADQQTLSQTYKVRPLGLFAVNANGIKGLHAGPHGSVWTSTAAIVVAQVLHGKTTTTALGGQGVPH